MPSDTPFTRSVLSRIADVVISPHTPRPYRLPTADDIMLLKLQWYVRGNLVSSNQRNDIIGVLQTQTQLDVGYLHRWAAILGHADLFAQICADAGIA